jgi:hypothetical protein
MSPDDREELLVEGVLGAYRERAADGLPVAPPEWWDLSAEGRERAFNLQLAARRMESLLDRRGWSGTVKAVLERLDQ